MAYNPQEPHALDHGNLLATLRFSQQAPVILSGKSASGNMSASVPIYKRDGPEEYDIMEQLFLSCLQTGDDQAASQCLERLTCRFGASNERIQGLRGLYQEAVAEKPSDLQECLRHYDEARSEHPLNLPILKRRISLLRSMSRPAEAIHALVDVLKAVPTDSESWCELADLYRSQGMVSQAIFCLEEALLVVPHAWNVHARLGEVLYTCACSSEGDSASQYQEKSIQYFCRSIELCDHYIRGLYGLALATSSLSETKPSSDRPQRPMGNLSKDTIAELNHFATKQLREIVERRSLDHHNWEHAQGELIAAKELLDRLDGVQ